MKHTSAAALKATLSMSFTTALVLGLSAPALADPKGEPGEAKPHERRAVEPHHDTIPTVILDEDEPYQIINDDECLEWADDDDVEWADEDDCCFEDDVDDQGEDVEETGLDEEVDAGGVKPARSFATAVGKQHAPAATAPVTTAAKAREAGTPAASFPAPAPSATAAPVMATTGAPAPPQVLGVDLVRPADPVPAPVEPQSATATLGASRAEPTAAAAASARRGHGLEMALALVWVGGAAALMWRWRPDISA